MIEFLLNDEFGILYVEKPPKDLNSLSWEILFPRKGLNVRSISLLRLTTVDDFHDKGLRQAAKRKKDINKDFTYYGFLKLLYSTFVEIELEIEHCPEEGDYSHCHIVYEDVFTGKEAPNGKIRRQIKSLFKTKTFVHYN
jgi:hypothetical protein